MEHKKMDKNMAFFKKDNFNKTREGKKKKCLIFTCVQHLSSFIFNIENIFTCFIHALNTSVQTHTNHVISLHTIKVVQTMEGAF